MALPFALSTTQHRRLYLVAVRPARTATAAQAIRATLPCRCRSADAALPPTGCCSPSLYWPCSASCPSPPPSPPWPPTLAALDRRALAAVDWGLLATFACFFVFAGNMARVPEVSAWLSPLMADHGLLGQRRLKPDHQQRARGRAALPFHGRMAAPARRREHRRRRHARRLTCEPHHAAALHQRAQNLPPSEPRCPSYPLVASSSCSAC